MDESEIAALEQALSLERFARYLDWAAGDRSRAIALYTLNAQLSESLYIPMQMLEIALRNRIHTVMSAALHEQWYDEPRCQLGSRQAEQLAKAKQDLTNAGRAATPGRIVAALTVGYWTAFFNTDYEDLWRKHLHRIAQRAGGEGASPKGLLDRAHARPAVTQSYCASRADSRMESPQPLPEHAAADGVAVAGRRRMVPSSLPFQRRLSVGRRCSCARQRHYAGGAYMTALSLDVRRDEASATAPAPVAAVIGLPTFLRSFQLRKAQVMWFLGAGASRAAGIKTAGDMIWEFKQKLYCSEKKMPLSFIADPGDPSVQRKMQAHFDEQAKYPSAGAEDEYSVYFDATYPAAKDRRAYIDEQVKQGKPSFGHFALSLLMQKGFCNAVWTTNFDHTLEDAAFKILGGSAKIVVADLGEPRKLSQAWSEARWPVYGKLHGDFHSENLKNTTAELQSQDSEMRRSLIHACRSQGLAIVGYSGRDASIMDALSDAIDNGRGYPGGLFWFKRAGDVPYPAVTKFVEKASAAGIDAHFVEVETFDELFSDITRFLPETEKAAQSITDASRPRLAKTSFRVAKSALPIISYPAACRLVECEIGGWEEIQIAREKSAADIVAQRCRAGVLAFGRDSEVKRTFDPYIIKAFDTHPITPGRLAKPTGERSLIRDALFRALERRPGLSLDRRGGDAVIFPDASIIKPSAFQIGDIKPVDYVSATLRRTGITWSEACSIRLDYRLDRLWLLIDPFVKLIIPEGTPEAEIDVAREFTRERQARRHNKAANAMINGWSRLIAGEDNTLRLRSFDISDGYDGDFELTRVSGFSGFAP